MQHEKKPVSMPDGIGLLTDALNHGNSHDDLLNSMKDKGIEDLQKEYEAIHEPKKPL